VRYDRGGASTSTSTSTSTATPTPTPTPTSTSTPTPTPTAPPTPTTPAAPEPFLLRCGTGVRSGEVTGFVLFPQGGVFLPAPRRSEAAALVRERPARRVPARHGRQERGLRRRRALDVKPSQQRDWKSFLDQTRFYGLGLHFQP
jgi:hypothetical protein